MKRCGHKSHVSHAQIISHFCRAKEKRCQLELINQATIKTGGLTTKTINKLRHGKISYLLDVKFFKEVI